MQSEMGGKEEEEGREGGGEEGGRRGGKRVGKGEKVLSQSRDMESECHLGGKGK